MEKFAKFSNVKNFNEASKFLEASETQRLILKWNHRIIPKIVVRVSIEIRENYKIYILISVKNSINEPLIFPKWRNTFPPPRSRNREVSIKISILGRI